MSNARATTARLIAPRASLAACVRAYVARSTIDAPMAPHERYNHFPATPACNITWFIHGSSVRVPGGECVPGPVVFRGPHTRPVVTYNPGPVQMFMLLILPDALHSMTGIDAGAHLNRLRPAQDVFDASWHTLLQLVLHAPDDATRVRHIEDFMVPRWQALQREAGAARDYADWVRALDRRAALSPLGCGPRQAERRVRAWTGLPLRTLRGLSRAERLFHGARVAQTQGRLQWADVATDAGYADQPHLCRESRRVIGLSPHALMLRRHDDEALWIYRLWD